MKDDYTRLEFIRLRAAGYSYRAITAKLNICRDTCSVWAHALKDEIDDCKREQLDELHTAYHMTRQARIERLGKTLAGIEDALAKADLESMPPEKLLDYKLKYAAALKDEYTCTESPYRLKKPLDADGLIEALEGLLERVQGGELTADQIARESTLLASILKAYETKTLQAKIDTLENILESK